jgi:thymidylate kinase
MTEPLSKKKERSNNIINKKDSIEGINQFITNHLKTNNIYIIFSGIDGSGKTTIIDSLETLIKIEGIETLIIWMRYCHMLLKPVHAFCRLVGLSKRHDTSYGKIWKHEFYHSQIFCDIYILLTWLDALIGKWRLSQKIIKNKPKVVLCDRWVNDILVDLSVDTRRAYLFKTKWYDRFQRILPRKTIQFLIVRDREDIISSRPECLEDPDFSYRQKMYELLEKNSNNLIVVHNNDSVDVVAKTVLKKLHVCSKN